MDGPSLDARSVAIYLPDLSGGGAERLHIGLAPFLMKAGFDVTLLLDRKGGELMTDLPVGLKVVALDARRQLHALPRLVAYLRSAKPDLLVANMEHMNIMALIARALARSGTRVIVCQHNALSEQAKRPSWQFKVLPTLYRLLLPRAEGIVAVSRGVATDMTACCGIKADRISVIYNGAITPDFEARKAQPADVVLDGDDARPLVVAVGRMVPQKDYPTLLEAFAIACRQSDLRLLILGEGPQRAELEATVSALGLEGRVEMPGFQRNPLPLIARARALVLASRFEGFGLVLAEALACGTPVVSTNCPHGPAEILENGRFGPLVPVGDAEAMANAMLAVLAAPIDAERLKARGRQFSLAECAQKYLDLFDRVLNGRREHTAFRSESAVSAAKPEVLT